MIHQYTINRNLFADDTNHDTLKNITTHLFDECKKKAFAQIFFICKKKKNAVTIPSL